MAVGAVVGALVGGTGTPAVPVGVIGFAGETAVGVGGVPGIALTVTTGRVTVPGVATV